jgi:5-methyltetrahydropteroyltriglutamate--homocysteine methyltransferase
MELKPPFRADQVGSLLRPPELRDAHERFLKNEFPLEKLQELQDKHIREVIAYQEDLGFQGVTDGEFRRTSFSSDFIEKLDGAKSPGSLELKVDAGAGQFAPRAFRVEGKLRHARPIEVEGFAFLKAHTRRTPKQTIPSPTMLLRGGREAVSRAAYPDFEEFRADVARVYREELAQLGAAGCTYVQLDDTNYAYLCDAKLRETFRQWGYDPATLADEFAALINASIAERPKGMIACVHICRGNSAGKWAAEGAYEPIAESLFTQLEVDGYFLEYDDARSGGFAPLRHYPIGSGKRIVLGLVSTKNPEIEAKDTLKRRIDEAAKFVPLEDLCISPQCGFASTWRGNPIGEDVQRRKLERVVEVAREVWGTS